MHFMTWMDEGVVAHVQGGEGFACKVGDPIPYLVMESRDEAALLIVQCMLYQECGIVAVAVGG